MKLTYINNQGGDSSDNSSFHEEDKVPDFLVGNIAKVRLKVQVCYALYNMLVDHVWRQKLFQNAKLKVGAKCVCVWNSGLILKTAALFHFT